MMENPESETTQVDPKRSRRWIRFGLLELLLLTGVIAAWLSVVNARRKIPRLQSEVQQMRFASGQLVINDRAKLNVRSLPTVWHNINSWKYSAPPKADLELRLATEGINTIGFPVDFQAVALPEGEHSIHMKSNKGINGYHTRVFIDDELVLQKDHTPAWLSSQGSTTGTDVTGTSVAYEPSEPLGLASQQYMSVHPLKQTSSMRMPEGYDQKGNYLWISPSGVIPKPVPNFVAGKSRTSEGEVGLRQGMRVLLRNVQGLHGLIGVQPSVNATLGDYDRWNLRCPLGISVCPVTDEGATVELPETSNPSLQQWGNKIYFSDSIQPPDRNSSPFSQNLVREKSISPTDQSMTTFAHFDAFASGAKPIVEILFDSAHPNRIGLLPRAAPDSAPMQAVQIVTRFDARFMWREIELAENELRDSKISTVSLSKLDESLGIKKTVNKNTTRSDWQRVPLSRLPRVSQSGSNNSMVRFSAITDVPDTSKILYPPGLQQKWKYEGVANRQVWLLPDSDSGISIDVRSCKSYPTTKFPVPGGPAIQNVRITVPMPAKQPVWLQIVAESDWTGK